MMVLAVTLHNIPEGMAVGVVCAGYLAGDTEIRFHNLPGDYTGTLWSQTYQNYQSYVFVNSSALLELVNTYLNPYQAEITSDMQHVIYDTTVNNLPVEGTTEESSAETQSGGTTE